MEKLLLNYTSHPSLLSHTRYSSTIPQVIASIIAEPGPQRDTAPAPVPAAMALVPILTKNKTIIGNDSNLSSFCLAHSNCIGTVTI
jgi:hypothetical protein